MRSLIRPMTAAALSAAWLLFLPAANAQTQAPSHQQNQPNDQMQMQNEAPGNESQGQAQSPQISDQKLNAAAAAMQSVIGLQHNYQQQIASAPPADKQRIAEQANNAMEKAVTDQGLSVEEYSSILQVAQNDPQVRQKLLQRLHPSSGQ